MKERVMNMLYQPLSVLGQLQKELDSAFFPRSTDEHGCDSLGMVNWQPSVDVKELNDKFVIQADLPGLESKDIDVHMDNQVLTISGQRKSEHEEKTDRGMTRLERRVGRFMRRFALPQSANAEKITAVCKHGVLTVEIAKVERAVPRRIEIMS